MIPKRLLALLGALVLIAVAVPGCSSVECKKNSQCSGTTPVCDTTNNVCVACLASGDCSGATPVCDTSNKVCVGCLGTSDCSGSTPFCDASSSTCSDACASNGECAAVDSSTPLCDPSSTSCVECLGNSDCSGATPFCGASHACTASCASNDDCASVDTAHPKCDTTSHLCVECLAQGDCSGDTPSCDTSTGVCKASCTDSTTCAINQDCNTSASQGSFCQDVDVAAASSAIDAIRTAAANGDTTSTQTVTGAIVTYLKPSVSGDPVGFTVQAEKAGPALFVAVDPTTVGDGLNVGDRITFTADTLDYASLGHVPNVTAISGFSLISSGHDASALRADISNIDPTATITSDDSRLISLTFDVATVPTTANTGYMKAEITTAGYTTASYSYWFYAPSTVFANDDLTNGCNAEITNGLLWRYGTNSYEDAEPATWQDSELTINSCPAPQVVSATSMSPTEVDVTFDRNIKADTLTAGAFTIAETDPPNDALAVSAAAAGSDARTVVLTTDTQGVGTGYTLTVDSTVKDDRSTSVDVAANTATFDGFVTPANLVISEFNPNVYGSNGGDLVELIATSAGTLEDDTILAEVNSSNKVKATLPALIVATNDVILVHITTSSTCSETTSKDECPPPSQSDTGVNPNIAYSDNAWDIVGGGSGFSYNSQVISVRGKDGNIIDAASFTDGSSGSAPAGFVGAVEMIETGDFWHGTSYPTICSDFTSCAADSFDWSGLGHDTTSSAERTDLAVPGNSGQWQLDDGTVGHMATFGTGPG